jgi:UDP-3-O-[3-hydroxymyristoyl] N-acetylglucosamine deacetylase
MFSLNQTTLQQKVSFSGVGLHTGEPSTLILSPAPENTGIQFVKNGVIIPALMSSVVNTSFATQLSVQQESIKTVEHLLSAFMALRLSNVFCEITGSEIPIMDGSSWPFYFAIKSIGLFEQQAPQSVAVITKNIVVQDNASLGILSPGLEQSFEFTIDYEHELIKKNGLFLKFSFHKNHYATDISRARTYGFLKDAPIYKEYGLAKGADLNNSLIFDDNQVLNLEGMRFVDEPIRHKILDAIGDLSLIGGPFMGHYHAIRPGHTLNIKIVTEALLQNAIEWVPAADLSTYTHSMNNKSLNVNDHFISS